MTDAERLAELGRRVEAMKIGESLERQWPDGRWKFRQVHDEHWNSGTGHFGLSPLGATEEADRSQAEGEKARAASRANYERYRCKAVSDEGLQCECDAEHLIKPNHYANAPDGSFRMWRNEA